MNKKFLSAILFGALMVTSTGTFVSCKDYDDDIENLNGQLNSQKADLEKQIADLEKQLTDANAETKAQLEQLKKELAAANKEAMDKIQAALDELKKNLTSLVFIPDFYYGGIEAMTVATYNYLPWVKQTAEFNANDDFSAVKDEQAAAPVQMAPQLVARYHVNPSSVTKDDIVDVEFLVADKKYESRGIEKAPTVELVGYEVEKGTLIVTGKITDGSIKMDAQNDTITVLAVQATLKKEEGTVKVTSDYAVVRSADREGFELALLSVAEKEAETEGDAAAQSRADVEINSVEGNVHMYTSIAEAIENEPQLELVWNSEGLDLADTLRTHLHAFEAECETALDNNANDKIAKANGLVYSYELVGYHSGANKTSESAHAALNGSVIRPQMPKDGVQQEFGAEQSKAEIGHMPLVRVTLTDEITGNIAAIGYVKLLIVAEAPAVKEWTIAHTADFAFDNAFTLGCEEPNTVMELKWHEVEEQIIAKLGVSKDEFHALYDLDDDYQNEGEDEASRWNVNQYDTVAVDAKALAAADYFGKVEMTSSDDQAEQTQILKWHYPHNDAYQIFKAGKKSIQAIVRYTNEEEMKYVYVTLTWTPKELNITPAGEILDEDKIDQYWYAHNSAEAKSGKDDIHANVEVVGTEDADCEFVTDMLHTFTGHKLTVANIDTVYADFQDELLDKGFVFDAEQTYTPVYGVSGAKYYLNVSENGKQLRAFTDSLAAVANTSGYQVVAKINSGKITYVGNEWAKDMLNYADHKELGEFQTVTAKLAITAGACEKVALENDKFYVKFLRPISVVDPGKTNFEDAETAGSSAKLVLEFTDWRDHNFNDSTATKGYDYYDYYGIQSIKADKANATTTLGKGGKLFEIAPKIEFDFVPAEPVTKDDMGTFTYANKEATVGEFEITVPLEVTYKWGVIKTSVTITVGKTVNN